MAQNVDNNYAASLRTLRVEQRITQEQLAAAIGVSRETVSNWENGESYPTVAAAAKVADIFGMSIDEMVRGK